MIIDNIDPNDYDWSGVTQWLEDTLTLFGPNGEYWAKGSYHNPDNGCRCLVGGLVRASTDPDSSYPRTLDPGIRSYSYPAEAMVQVAIMDKFPYRDNGESVIGFNDHYKTTWPEVKQVMTEAIRLAKEKAEAQNEAFQAG